LDARGATVVEDRVDRRADRAARVQDVVDQDDRPSFEREVEPGRAHERLRMPRRLIAPHLNVVAVEGDVERAQRDFAAGELLDQPAEAVCERHAARVNADECDLLEVGVAFDDLVGDAREAFRDRRLVQERFRARLCRQRQPHSFPASRDRVKGRGAEGSLARPADGGARARRPRRARRAR
jgi:hypothetical protein